MIRKRMCKRLACLLATAVVFGVYDTHQADAGNVRTYTGTVTRVSDGDTLKFVPDILVPDARLNKKGEVSVRLYGIDTPETKGLKWPAQPFAYEAKRYLAGLVDGRRIECRLKDIDRYGRAVCIVSAGGRNINVEMIRAGYAWAYIRYLDRPHVSEYERMEREARKARRGLWKDHNPTPPWEWRKRHR